MGSKDDVVSLALSDDTAVSIHLHGTVSLIVDISLILDYRRVVNYRSLILLVTTVDPEENRDTVMSPLWPSSRFRHFLPIF